MVDQSGHAACVDAWMASATPGLAPGQLLHAFETAFVALWRRAHITLGDVTLTAIVDRVLYGTAERFPMLAPLRVGPGGLEFHELHQRASGLDGPELAEGLRCALVEFLTVLGNLTAEILTPALHAELRSLISGPRPVRSEEKKS
jgi:hypothetical protein